MNRLRWWERILGVSVRMKIMGIALGMLVLLSLGVVWHVRSVFQQTLRDELETRGYSLARTLAVRSADFVLTRDLFELHKLVSETSKQYEDLRYVFILNNQGEVLAHTFGALFPIDLLYFNTGFASGATHIEIVSSEEGPIWDVAAPILEGQVGVVRIGLTEARIQRRIYATTRYLLLVTLGITFLGTFAAYVLTAVMTRPIRELETVAKHVGARDFTKRAAIRFHDEVGRLAEVFNEMIGGLAESEAAIDSYNRELLKRDRDRRKLLHQLMVAQEGERHRIARELHDETSQSLAALSIALGSIENAVKRGDTVDERRIQPVQQMAKDILNEVRRIMQKLRPTTLDDLGLLSAIRWWIQQYADESDTEFHLAFPSGRLVLPIPHGISVSEVQVHLFRIIQEGITNILRHASAKHAQIVISTEEEKWSLVIADDGIGFDRQQAFGVHDETAHFGLRGIVERVELLGGKLEIITEIGEGTQLQIEIPDETEGGEDGKDPDFTGR